MAKPAWTLHGKPLPVLPPPWDPLSMKEAQEAFSTVNRLPQSPGFFAPSNRRALASTMSPSASKRSTVPSC